MKPFTLYISNTVGDSTNCQYPIKVEVTNEIEFKEAIQFGSTFVRIGTAFFK